MLQATELKKKGRPRIRRKGTLFLDGYGISIKIADKKLQIRNGESSEIKRLEIRNGDFNLYQQDTYFTGLTLTDHSDYDKIVIQGSGYITFDALQWLTEWGINVVMLDKRGRLYGNFNQVAGSNEPLIRQKQYDAFRNEKKLEYLRKWIVSHKVTNQIMILRELQAFRAVEQVERQLFSLEDAHTIYEISEIESNSATRYYTALTRFFKPEFGFRTRKNPMTKRHNEANDIVNSLLNYGFGILQAEIGKQLNGIGLDCSVGFMHNNHPSHVPLIWDMMEPFRYFVDRSVLQIADSITESDYHFERGNLGYPFPIGSASKRWLIMSDKLRKRYVAILGSILESERYQKAHVGRHANGFQKMKEMTIMKEFCLELRDYILERKKSLSQPQKLLTR